FSRDAPASVGYPDRQGGRRARMRLSKVVLLVFLAVLVAGGGVPGGCKKAGGGDVTAESIEGADGTLIEDQEGGSIAWYVGPDGKVKPLVKTSDGKPVDKGASGSLVWKGPTSEAKLTMTPDEKTGMLLASG